MKSKKGTWPQAIFSFLCSILLVLSVRWLLVEAYVIPSASMLPTLKINDHIFVNKLAFGIRLPFSSKWVLRYGDVERGDIVVFRSVRDSDIFFIKRVVGVAGDKIDYTNQGELSINGQPVARQPLGEGSFKEKLGDVEFVTQLDSGRHRFDFSATVPEGHFFVLGDNRDNSSDSRYWGAVPVTHILGTPLFIWLSCNSNKVHAVAQCEPENIRWDRFGQVVK